MTRLNHRWKVRPFGGPYTRRYAIDSDTGENLGSFENPVDAQCAATAPSLLDALKDATENCSCTFGERGSGHRIDCHVPEWFKVIDQAEGKEQADKVSDAFRSGGVQAIGDLEWEKNHPGGQMCTNPYCKCKE